LLIDNGVVRFKDETLNAPVLGTKENFVLDVVAALFPVEFAEITGYQVPADEVLSVIAILVAFVAVVALVALVALPFKEPVKLVDVTLLNPAIVVAVAPNAILVEPIVRLELVKAPFGIFVRFAPDPLNPVAVKSPVDGLNWYLVELEYCVDVVPLVTLENRG
jgi:hypothetical protein